MTALPLFVIASIAGLISAAFIYPVAKKWGGTIGIVAIVPLIAYWSNATHQPVPFEIELVGFHGAALAALIAWVWSLQEDRPKRTTFIVRISATVAILAAITSLTIVYGLTKIGT